jgi:hypothetical protein
MPDTYRDTHIHITSDFEGGNGENIQKVGMNEYAVDARIDHGNTDAYFDHVSHQFALKIRSIEVDDLEIVLRLRNVTHDKPLLKHVWCLRDGTWNKIPPKDLINEPDSVEIIITVPVSKKGVVVSNRFWWPYSEQVKWMRKVVSEYPLQSELINIGRTAMGTEIIGLKLSTPKEKAERRRRICVQGSLQGGSEIGDSACRAVVEFLLETDEGRDFLNRYRVEVIPQPNPDCNILGGGMLNSTGDNPQFGFDKVDTLDRTPVETRLEWKWVTAPLPEIWIDYHSFFQDDRSSFNPILYDHLPMHSEERQIISDRLNEAVIKVSPGEVFHRPGVPYDEQLLMHQLRTRYDVYVMAYKLHMRESLDKNCEQAVKVFRALLGTYSRLVKDV